MPEKKIESWDAYRDAYRTDIPKGKESEHIAKVLVGHKFGKKDPQPAFDRKKADKEAARMMKNPLFREQMASHPEEMMAMLSQGQYDKMLKTAVSPLPVKKDTLKTAYEELEQVGKKMRDGSYGLSGSKEWNELSRQVSEATAERQKNPQMSEVRQFMNLIKVYSAFKELDARMPGSGPEHEKMTKFGFDILTALGGGKEAASQRLKEHFEAAEREIQEIERDAGATMEATAPKPKPVKPEKTGPAPMM